MSDHLQTAIKRARHYRRIPLTQGPDGGLIDKIIHKAGDIEGKRQPPQPLSTHLINVITTGLGAYAYETAMRDIEPPNTRPYLLTAALALHDANKYVENATDYEGTTNQNTSAVLDAYYDAGDPFGILSLLPQETATERKQARRDIKWLVQRTESRDRAEQSLEAKSRRAKTLSKYCTIGDQFASRVNANGLEDAASNLQDTLGDDHVQYYSVRPIEQPVLNNHLLGCLTDVITHNLSEDNLPDSGGGGVLLGSTQDAIAYLGDPIDRTELQNCVRKAATDKLIEYDLQPKTTSTSIGLESLDRLYPSKELRSQLQAGLEEQLISGKGLSDLDDGDVDTVAQNVSKALPELAYTVYSNLNATDPQQILDTYPPLGTLWEQVKQSDAYNNQTAKIGFLHEVNSISIADTTLFLSPESAPPQSAIRSATADLHDGESEALLDALSSDQKLLDTATDRLFASTTADSSTPITADSTCFLCGRPAEKKYQPGNNAIYQSQGHSRRGRIEQAYKRVCPLCELEHKLACNLATPDNDVTFAFVKYTDLLADLTTDAHFGEPGSEQPAAGNTALTPIREYEDGLGTPDIVAETFGPQYHPLPIKVSGTEARLDHIRALLEAFVAHGFGVHIGRQFDTSGDTFALFSDGNPTQQQVNLGLDQITNFEELARARQLFEIDAAVSDDTNDMLTAIDRPTFHQLTHHVLSIKGSTWNPQSDLAEQLETYLDDTTESSAYMHMKHVAELGAELYEKPYASKHTKTKPFKTVLTAIINYRSRQSSHTDPEQYNDELVTYAAGQVMEVVRREEYASRIDPDEAERYTTAVLDYLVEEVGLDLSVLPDEQPKLINAYLFAYNREVTSSNDN